jgi:phosphoribosylanthranilate isomerase
MSQDIQIKICGLTNREDAQAAIEAGADALGFNLWPGSKRCVDPTEIIQWLPSLPDDVLKVAVVVNPTIEEVRRCHGHFDVVQLHGQETPDFCIQAAQSGPIWKALPLSAELDPSEYKKGDLLIDTAIPGSFGGTGIPIDFTAAADFVHRNPARPIWLAGGLTPENVADAVRTVRPFGVDVASGVEFSGNPRRKDPARIRAFIKAIFPE